MPAINILEFSKEIKNDADQILKETGIIEILNQFGEVRVGGSYAFDLMYKPDIDIDVIISDPRNSAISALNKIIEHKIVQKLEFGDFETYPRINRPQAYIIVLKVEKNGRKWEVEIWFKMEISKELAELNERLKNVTEDERLKILELKKEGGKQSVDIYREVLNFDKTKN